MTDSELKFSYRAIRRKKLFLPISIISVVIGLGLAMFYIWQAVVNPDYNITIHFVLVILILLSARQNLRQHYYVKIIEKLLAEVSMSDNTPNRVKNGDSTLPQNPEGK